MSCLVTQFTILSQVCLTPKSTSFLPHMQGGVMFSWIGVKIPFLFTGRLKTHQKGDRYYAPPNEINRRYQLQLRSVPALKKNPIFHTMKSLDLTTSHRKYRGRWSLCEMIPQWCNQPNPHHGKFYKTNDSFLQQINDMNGRRERRNNTDHKTIKKKYQPNTKRASYSSPSLGKSTAQRCLGNNLSICTWSRDWEYKRTV